MLKLYIYLSFISALICNVSSDATATTSTITQDATNSSSDHNKKVLKTFQVEHSIIPNTFTPRGTIQISMDDEGNLESSFHKSTESYLSHDQLTGLDNIIANKGYYKIRVQDETTGASVLASVPGCDVKRANFREDIGIVLGNTGTIISLSYKPLVSPLASQCHELEPFAVETDQPQQQQEQEQGQKSRKHYDFKTKVSLSSATAGIVIPAVLPNSRPPMGYDWIKRSVSSSKNNNDGVDSLQNKKESGGQGESTSIDDAFDPLREEKSEQHQSFMRRYWYIILPVVLMTFMAPEEPAPNQARGNVGGGSGSNVAAAGVASSTTAAAGNTARNSGLKQRRGKRG